MTTLKTLLKELSPLMTKMVAENPLRELRLLVAHALNTTYDDVFFNEEQIINDEQVSTIKKILDKRLAHMPLSKIIGKKEFWGLPFDVTADTLDPRPESETLIDAILEIYTNKKAPLTILDLGTGSGCLLLSVLHEYPLAKGIGVDISQEALIVAQRNACNLILEDRCQFIQGFWFDALREASKKFDLIISNPPYIPKETQLSLETLHDPESALFSEENGLLHYRLILERARHYLAPQGKLVFEIGQGQDSDVIKLANQNNFHLFLSRKDLLGHTRCLIFNNEN